MSHSTTQPQQAGNRSVFAIPAEQLTDLQWSVWERLLENNPTITSPYFHPKFTQAVAAVRRDIEVGIIEDNGQPILFFPFQRCRFHIGVPVGGRLSDFHGVIAASNAHWSVDELLAGCRLRAWDFTHLPTTQKQFVSPTSPIAESSFIDLSNGYEHYRNERHLAKSRTFKHMLQMSRKIEREVGPLKFEWHSPSAQNLHQLINWKSQQYRRTGFVDIFSSTWIRQLLEKIHKTQEKNFRGSLATLSIGDQPIAYHFGMQCQQVLHSWFPVYNTQFHKYSPGLLLLLNIIQSCEQYDCMQIDLGDGAKRFKLSLRNRTLPITSGSIESGNLTRTIRQSWKQAQQWLSESLIGNPMKRSVRAVRLLKNRCTFL